MKVQRLSLEVLTNALIEFGESPVESKQILSLGVEKRSVTRFSVCIGDVN